MLALLLAGCVTSEQSRYGRHLTAVVEQGPAGSDDLAIAFGLDQYAAGTDAALVAAESDAPP